MVRKIGINQTQILHRMTLRQFKPRQLIPDISLTPREGQPDPEVVIKHDDFYARAWVCEYDKAIFVSDRDNMIRPKSPEITVKSKEAADEKRSTPVTTRACSPEVISQVDNS